MQPTTRFLSALLNGDVGVIDRAGPAVVRNAFAREVKDRVDPFQAIAFDLAGGGVPEDRVRVACVGAIAYESEHTCAVRLERLGEGLADQARRASDRDRARGVHRTAAVRPPSWVGCGGGPRGGVGRLRLAPFVAEINACVGADSGDLRVRARVVLRR